MANGVVGQRAARHVVVGRSTARTALPPRPPVEARTVLQQTAKPRSKTATKMLAYLHRRRLTVPASGAAGDYVARHVVEGRSTARTALPPRPPVEARTVLQQTVKPRSRRATRLIVVQLLHVLVSGAPGESAVYLVE